MADGTGRDGTQFALFFVTGSRMPLPALGRILETAVYIDDRDAARRFYVDILGFAPLLDTPRMLALDVAGQSVLLLFQRGATSEPLVGEGGVIPPHGAEGQQHLAFAIPADALDSWIARLEREGIEIESRVRWARGGESIYLRDPDGHSVELATPGVWKTY